MNFLSKSIEAGGHYARLDLFLLSPSEFISPNRRWPLAVICPGGAYGKVSPREAEPIAVQLNAMGIHAAVLYYTVADQARFPTALSQLAAAVSEIRRNAEAWAVIPDEITVMGFSAGGHLAGSLSVLWRKPVMREILPEYMPEEIRPDRAVLCYPVITPFEYGHRQSFENLLGDKVTDPLVLELTALERQVDRDTPPTFLWHTAEDKSVMPQNSLLYLNALLNHGVPCEFHLYPKGPHGLSLANEETAALDSGREMVVPSCQNWIYMAGRFIKMELRHD